MRQGYRLGRALLVEHISTVAAVMFAIRESEGSTASHADVGVDPFRGLCDKSVRTLDTKTVSRHTYRTAVDHAAGHCNFGRELEALSLECLVNLANVVELIAAFRSCSP